MPKRIRSSYLLFHCKLQKQTQEKLETKESRGREEQHHQTTTTTHQSPPPAFPCPISARNREPTARSWPLSVACSPLSLQKQSQKASPSSLCRSSQKAERKQSSEVTGGQLPPRSQSSATPQLPPRISAKNGKPAARSWAPSAASSPLSL
ncbi:hypothetical protein SLEP1_g25745 [Rubroshorea leprosula]|uniref:Uncharacterized protein n=1 Tax=Rubroshorea leprosula TaxID=152421 RepID=A0AAV5JK51_9ROSI|nr:hypothetical protein SLEP1_g25745 [Rubroshorea leprosula]